MSKCTECKYERLSECEYPYNMYNPTYLKAVLIYVRDKQTGYIHIVGTDQHDRLYLDDNGNIQYMNLHNGGTTEGDYEFVLDEQGHNQNNLTFTKE